MKSKASYVLVQKPSSGEHATKVEQEACWAVHKVSSSKPAGGGGFPSWDDGYVHGSQGISGDEQVDSKAKGGSQICEVKEGCRVEEVNMMDEVVAP